MGLFSGSDLSPVFPSGFDAEDDLHAGLLPSVQFHGADRRPRRRPRCQFGLQLLSDGNPHGLPEPDPRPMGLPAPEGDPPPQVLHRGQRSLQLLHRGPEGDPNGTGGT